MRRRRLEHKTPEWVEDGASFFVTINAECRGQSHFCGDDELKVVARALLDGVRHYHREGKWFAHLVVIMPDHLHAILSFPRGGDMRETIRAWKSFQTRRLGLVWQDGFYDHRIRNGESFNEKMDYIRENPVRAGLCERAEEWEWVVRYGEGDGD
ncbi:MAG: hypothetical protein AAGD22_15280 [Verrucomicrobiota bacterium]